MRKTAFFGRKSSQALGLEILVLGFVFLPSQKTSSSATWKVAIMLKPELYRELKTVTNYEHPKWSGNWIYTWMKTSYGVHFLVSIQRFVAPEKPKLGVVS